MKLCLIAPLLFALASAGCTSTSAPTQTEALANVDNGRATRCKMALAPSPGLRKSKDAGDKPMTAEERDRKEAEALMAAGQARSMLMRSGYNFGTGHPNLMEELLRDC